MNGAQNQNDLKSMLNAAYDVFEGSPELHAYQRRHGVCSASVLTVADDDTAAAIAAALAPRIEGRVVVEVGGGIGLLAFHLGAYAARVFCIEANPVWGSCFFTALLETKPKNVSYLFGAADEFAGLIRADVALFCTHSGAAAMRAAGALFAPVVIDVYGELLKDQIAALHPDAAEAREMPGI